MADVIPPDGSRANGEAEPRRQIESFDRSAEIVLIELLFFAYRDFTSDPDAILESYGFGRAHHRVLHFVNRHPGMPVAKLLRILRITKQSLGRVLKQLIDKGFVEQRPGPRDRRQRLLFATAAGRDLAARLLEPQVQRVQHAIEALPEARRGTARQFLEAMIDEAERSSVVDFVGAPPERP